MFKKITNSNLAKLLIGHNVFYFGRTFFDVFIDVLVWSATKDVRVVAAFKIAYLSTHTLSFFIFGEHIKKINNVLIKNIGLLGFASTIVALSFFTDFFMNNAYLLGLLFGIFNGMYWINYHVVSLDLTNKTVRAKYSGWDNSFKVMVGLIVPIIGGAMLVFLPGSIGEKVLFLSAVSMFVLALFLGNFKTHKSKYTNGIEYVQTTKIMLRDKQTVKMLLGLMLGGFVRRGAFFTTLVPLLIFASVKNEFEFGNIMAIVSIIAAVSFVFIGKRIQFSQYKKSIYIGSFLQLVGILLVYFQPTVVSFLLYLIIQKLSLPFIQVPRKVIWSNMVHKIKDYKNHRVEYIAISEFVNIMLGWVPSYFLLLFFSDIHEPKVIQILLGIMVVFIIFEMKLITSIPQKDYSD